MKTETAPVSAPPVPQVVANELPQSTGLEPLAEEKPASSNTFIIGRVVLKGTPPPEDKLPKSDGICGRLIKGPVFTKRYVVSPNGGLANVLVYISSGLEGQHFSRPAAATLAQTNCQFQPYLVALMKDQVLDIHNSDEVVHYVLAEPNANGNQPFRFSVSPGQTREERFHSPEIPIRIRSGDNPLALAYVCVVDNPFFAVTDANGNFSISNAPPGDYILKAYHLRSSSFNPDPTQPVSVLAGSTVTANFTIELPDKLAKKQ